MMNLYAAWMGIIMGCIAGAITGLFFHRESWLGGYNSWERRMVRLGHISFFGIGFINFMFAMTVNQLNLTESTSVSGVLLIIGLIAMPSVCYLSAYRKFFRHLFFIPVSTIVFGILLFLIKVV